MLSITEEEVNVLAQRFYEASGISLPTMTDKSKIVAGLEAVFTELGIESDGMDLGFDLNPDPETRRG